MRYLALLLVISTAAADAQTLHKCRNADGTSSYQQTPCDSNAAPVETRHVPQVADSGPAYVTPPPRPQANPRPRTGQNRATGIGNPLLDKPADDSKLYGYSCNDGARSWVQFTPCPDKSYRAASGIYVDAATGRVSDRLVTIARPVTQRKITSRERCSGPVTSGTDADETYERNKRC